MNRNSQIMGIMDAGHMEITDDCINCGSCAKACPREAIIDGDEKFVVDTERCSIGDQCGTPPRCSIGCPVECIIVAS